MFKFNPNYRNYAEHAAPNSDLNALLISDSNYVNE